MAFSFATFERRPRTVFMSWRATTSITCRNEHKGRWERCDLIEYPFHPVHVSVKGRHRTLVRDASGSFTLKWSAFGALRATTRPWCDGTPSGLLSIRVGLAVHPPRHLRGERLHRSALEDPLWELPTVA